MKKVLLLAILSLSLFIVSCGDDANDVVFSVTGDASTAIVSWGAESSTNSDDNATLPWSSTLTLESGEIVSLAATNSVGNSGSITARITVDGEVIETATATGEFAFAFVAGEVP